MNIKRAAGVLVVVMATLSVTACGHMSNRDRNTAIGAGVGAVGGAALGGIIGHQTSR
ncbi:osmotically-inducible lipoprotein B [Serratia marcescens]|uniref:osmotically-inducible lipoprotein B n=1 Tax=Serratia marcescens TaxID=615 RepID=UPI003ED9849B